jgi:peptidyl-Asp metalloendopeptidase
MKRPNLTLGLFALVLISFATTTTRAQTRTPQHFMRERGVTRVRALDRSSLSVLSQAALDRFFTKQPSASISQTMNFDLFDGTSVTVDLDRIEQQSDTSVAWHGKVRDAPLGSATFVRTGNSVIGSVTRGDGKIYQVRTEEDGTQWMVEIDQAAFPAADEAESVSSPPVPLPTEAQPDATAEDDGSTIDVMVLYTPAARAAAGGATQIQQLIQLGIAETNAGYSNSGVTQRVRLVYSGEVSYTESTEFSTDLDRLSNSGDGFLDEVASLRDTYGADLVSLWRSPNSSVCGLAWVLNRVDLAPAALASYGFSVVAEDCATGYYSFGHEMGHNMGTDHAKDDNTPHGPYAYGSGYKQTTGTKWRTIMAYDGNCSCARINYWSNPTVLYNGLPAGVDPNSVQGAANYQVLNNTRAIVANFRAAITGGPPADATGPQLTITSPANNQTVSTGTITVSGTATDGGRGDSGISSVTVNGVRATGDTATGLATANWSRTITLSPGANTITVVAKDNSAAQNSTTLTITVNLGTPTSSNPSPTASTYHVFPQFADGRFSDGTSYRTTLMIANPSSTSSASCTLQMRGFTVPGFQTSYSLGASGWVIMPTSGVQNFVSGYATLSCSANVEAQVLYSYYGANGVKVSEATVFSSPSAFALGMLSDERDGGRFAIAIANDSDHSVTYTVFVDAAGFSGSKQIPLNARSSTAAFIGELVNGIPANAISAVSVVASSSSESGSVIGLRYTGGVFTTMPANPVSSVGANAATYHVFPQFADGRFSDGTYYRTSRLYLNPSSTLTADCMERLRGTTTTTSPFTLAASTSIVGRTSGTQTFQSGYATLSCTGTSVYAQAVYSLYTPNGIKASEATVFSSPSVARSQILADNREGARVGIAIANDSDQVNTYTITAYDSNGAVVGSASKTLQARTSTADFVDNFITGIPANYYGQVIVESTTGGTVSVIGLRFTGAAFTTIPAIVR